jgi:DNA-binding NtrC family response regulator
MGAILRAEGFDVCPCVSVAEALRALARRSVDVAILDINVEEGLVYPAADALESRDIPYGFCSSMEPSDVPASHRQAPFLSKPFDLEQLVSLARLLERMESGRHP